MRLSKSDIEKARAALLTYERMVAANQRIHTDRAGWIALKLSCSPAKARALEEAVDNPPSEEPPRHG